MKRPVIPLTRPENISFGKTMGDNIVTKPLELVLIITAHMVFNGVIGHIQAEIVGVFSTNITLQFTFKNVNQTNYEHFALYGRNDKKITECSRTSRCLDMFANPENRSIFYHIRNLNHNHSQVYYASLFIRGLPKESNRVRLVVREDNQSSTVSPDPTFSTTKEGDGSSNGALSSHIVTVLVVSLVLLLAAMFPWLIWSLARTRDTRQQTPTTQESNEMCHQVPASSLVYSVLDFPKRPQAVIGGNLSDTEYADVSCVPEKI